MVAFSASWSSNSVSSPLQTLIGWSFIYVNKWAHLGSHSHYIQIKQSSNSPLAFTISLWISCWIQPPTLFISGIAGHRWHSLRLPWWSRSYKSPLLKVRFLSSTQGPFQTLAHQTHTPTILVFVFFRNLGPLQQRLVFASSSTVGPLLTWSAGFALVGHTTTDWRLSTRVFHQTEEL